MLVLYLGSPSFLATLHAIGRRNKSVPNNSLEICFYSLVCFRSPSLDVKQHIYRGSYNLVVVLFHYFFLDLICLRSSRPSALPYLLVHARELILKVLFFFFSGASLSSPLSVFFASILSAMKSRSRCCCSLPFMTSSFLLYCCQHQRLN